MKTARKDWIALNAKAPPSPLLVLGMRHWLHFFEVPLLHVEVDIEQSICRARAGAALY